MTNQDQWSALEGLAKAASPGPWQTERLEPECVRDANLDIVVMETERLSDASFIAAANPSTVLALIAENRALSFALDTAQSQLTIANRRAALADREQPGTDGSKATRSETQTGGSQGGGGRGVSGRIKDFEGWAVLGYGGYIYFWTVAPRRRDAIAKMIAGYFPSEYPTWEAVKRRAGCSVIKVRASPAINQQAGGRDE